MKAIQKRFKVRSAATGRHRDPLEANTTDPFTSHLTVPPLVTKLVLPPTLPICFPLSSSDSLGVSNRSLLLFLGIVLEALCVLFSGGSCSYSRFPQNTCFWFYQILFLLFFHIPDFFNQDSILQRHEIVLHFKRQQIVNYTWEVRTYITPNRREFLY